MAERIDQWPRVHSCLYDWCPEQREECSKCDALVGIMRKGNVPDATAISEADFGRLERT